MFVELWRVILFAVIGTSIKGFWYKESYLHSRTQHHESGNFIHDAEL